MWLTYYTNRIKVELYDWWLEKNFSSEVKKELAHLFTYGESSDGEYEIYTDLRRTDDN